MTVDPGQEIHQAERARALELTQAHRDVLKRGYESLAALLFGDAHWHDNLAGVREVAAGINENVISDVNQLAAAVSDLRDPEITEPTDTVYAVLRAHMDYTATLRSLVVQFEQGDLHKREFLRLTDAAAANLRRHADQALRRLPREQASVRSGGV